jgi:hypothetical protein
MINVFLIRACRFEKLEIILKQKDQNSTESTRVLEDTKGVTRTRISKKDRQHDGKKVKDLMTNNYLQNTTQKI